MIDLEVLHARRVRRRSDDEPHVTIVHPRHSNLGWQAWETLRTLDLAGASAVTEVGITVFDGRVWRTVERLPLGNRRAD